MATHDYVIANGTGAAVRSDLNGALAAIVSNNSSATEPATMYAYQWWPDTTTGLLKQRNSANSAWITIGTLASTNLGLLSLAGGTMTGVLAVTAGTAALPGIAVSGDTNTGITSPGADQLAISTGGTIRATVDSSGRLLVGTSTSALEKLVVLGDGGGIQINRNQTGTPTSGQALGSIGFKGIVSANSNAAAEVLIQASADENHSGSTSGSRLEFHTKPSGIGPGSAPTERMRITQAGLTSLFSSASSTFIPRSSAAADTSNFFIQGAYGATNTTTGTVSFQVFTNGNVQNTNNSYGAISDVKLKENIVDATSQWSDIKALQVRNYNFKEGQTHTQIGLVAQEVELVSPGLVTESPDRDAEGNDLGTVTKSINYSVLYMKAVKALQEAMERIETLEASNADMLARLTALEAAAGVPWA